MHGVNDAHVIDAAANVRENLADMRAAFAVLLKLKRRFEQVAGRRRNDAGQSKRQRLTMIAFEQRFVIERIDLRRTAVHEQENDLFRPRRVMRRSGGEAIGGRTFVTQQRCQRQATEPRTGCAQHLAAVHWSGDVVTESRHGFTPQTEIHSPPSLRGTDSATIAIQHRCGRETSICIARNRHRHTLTKM